MYKNILTRSGGCWEYRLYRTICIAIPGGFSEQGKYDVKKD